MRSTYFKDSAEELMTNLLVSADKPSGKNIALSRAITLQQWSGAEITLWVSVMPIHCANSARLMIAGFIFKSAKLRRWAQSCQQT
jgi:hypothetical protein